MPPWWNVGVTGNFEQKLLKTFKLINKAQSAQKETFEVEVG